MSRMGQFVYECQEIAESNYNESRDVVIAEVERAFFRDKSLIPMAMTTALEHWEEIQRDMMSF
ncbi:MAG: hypothetical protein CMA07_05820 [Euryarchaeota archaeon]|nr:hypothetical protein [Euryarchaeota archaeon]